MELPVLIVFHNVLQVKLGMELTVYQQISYVLRVFHGMDLFVRVLYNAPVVLFGTAYFVLALVH